MPEVYFRHVGNCDSQFVPRSLWLPAACSITTGKQKALHLTWNQPLLVKKSQGWYVTNDLVWFQTKDSVTI